jgi:molybdate transport repressor ModE-like protein
MDDRRIRILHEALRAGSMRAAADALDVAPSSVSRQIAALEREVGAELVEHGRRDIRLTEAGRRVIDYFRENERRRKRLTEELSDLAGNLTGQVQIAIGEGFLGSTLYGALDEFAGQFPNVALAVRVTDTTEIIRLIGDDDLHFGIVFHPSADFQLVSRFSARVPLKLLLRPDHRLAGQATLGLKQLEGERLALIEPRFRIRQFIDIAAIESRAALTCAVETNSIAMLVEAARSGRALTILPEFSADADIVAGRLRAIPLTDSALQPLYVHMISRAKRHFSRPVEFLMDRLKARLGPLAH